jgi:hypothetical protein
MIMKKFTALTLITMLIMLAGCEVVGGIFKAGVWFGILIIVGIVALLIWVFTRGRR